MISFNSGVLNASGEMIARFVTPLSMISNQPTYSDDTLTLQRRHFTRNAQRWEIEGGLEPLKEGSNLLFDTLLMGSLDTSFKVRIPQPYGSIQTIWNSIGVGGNSISAYIGEDGSFAPVHPNNLVPVGTFIKIDNNSKIFLLTSQGLYPKPPAVSTGTLLIHYGYPDVVGTFTLSSESIKGITFEDGILTKYDSVKFIEVIGVSV